MIVHSTVALNCHRATFSIVHLVTHSLPYILLAQSAFSHPLGIVLSNKPPLVTQSTRPAVRKEMRCQAASWVPRTCDVRAAAFLSLAVSRCPKASGVRSPSPRSHSTIPGTGHPSLWHHHPRSFVHNLTFGLGGRFPPWWRCPEKGLNPAKEHTFITQDGNKV